MKTILVTGGTDGIGKGLVLHYLAEGCKVFAVGSSAEKGNRLMAEANNPNLVFLQANLSLVSENLRVVQAVSEQVDHLDSLVLCAASLQPQPAYIETSEGIEFTFALYYLSRYVLCYQLKDLLEKSQQPVILNVAAPGMKGEVFWDDLQMKQNYNGTNAQFHGSRLNDLLGVSFTETDTIGKIRYILFNPMAARTPGAKKMGGDNVMMKVMMTLFYKFCGKDVSELVEIIDKDIRFADTKLSAFKLDKAVDLTMETFQPENAKRLDEYTKGILKRFA